MPSKPPYIIRTEDDEMVSETIDGALEAAATLYDPSGPIPEIVDDDGRIVFDPSEIIGKLIERQAR